MKSETFSAKTVANINHNIHISVEHWRQLVYTFLNHVPYLWTLFAKLHAKPWCSRKNFHRRTASPSKAQPNRKCVHVSRVYKVLPQRELVSFTFHAEYKFRRARCWPRWVRRCHSRSGCRAWPGCEATDAASATTAPWADGARSQCLSAGPPPEWRPPIDPEIVFNSVLYCHHSALIWVGYETLRKRGAIDNLFKKNKSRIFFW